MQSIPPIALAAMLLSVRLLASPPVSLPEEPAVDPPAPIGTWRHETYGENVYLSREDVFSLSLQHRSDYLPAGQGTGNAFCGTGVHGGYEIAMPAGMGAEFYNYSYSYLAPGLICRGSH